MVLEPKTASLSNNPDGSTRDETLADGRYVIWRKLGSGAQAETLEAVDRRDGRAVAVKRFLVSHARSWKDVELAEREARVLSSLSHPALPAYVDHFEEHGTLYLVMERVEGESLASLIKSGKRLSINELGNLLNTLAVVLEYLHTRVPPVIHRDIKPGNVIRRPDGKFCLVDFGSVRDGLRPEGGSTVAGTFGYMAPEQFQGRALPATDVYGVGALLLSLITGKPPEALPHQGLAIDVTGAIGGAVPPGWVKMISRMVEIDPDRRPSRLQPLLVDLNRSDMPLEAELDDNCAPSLDQQLDVEERSPDASFTVMLGTGFGLLPFLALTIARLAIWAALGVIVPTVLHLLAILFGARLRQAAWQVSQAGSRARAQLAQASRHIQRAEPFVLQGRHYRRQGVQEPERKEANDDGRTHRRAGSLFKDDDGSPSDGKTKK